MKKDPIRLSSVKSARVIDEKFTELLEKFVERANKEQDELTARHRAEHAGIWNNIRAHPAWTKTNIRTSQWLTIP
ncbi:hypothetical protein LMA2_gp07_1 [Pseudomonas phage LMA2]|uniref:Uncharacterized protein n=1 Tax=Pseudomonas phage LMA2 TaxID=549446 RepID=B5M9Z6_9CAUD|nr:hypothetical protein LMA2_gp07_1 [Pseudomonas phage LMA2]CAR31249.1 hypothetical protein [Pseudomonas phage LMA2]